jgi:uncharacterized damage-inducible protein DinB
MPMIDALVPEFDHEMTLTRKLLERVPEGKLAWKPHEKSMSLGELATHLANLPRWGDITLNQSEIDLAGTPPNPVAASRAELLGAFDALVATTRAALVGKSDAEMMAPWTLKREGHAVFSMPKAAVWRSFVLSHIVHHRGQLTVYLRMHDVALPSIYGPSADEGAF